MPPVDRAARDNAALLIRRYMAGQITNDALWKAWPVSKDPAIREIWNIMWMQFDDLYEHSTVGANALWPSTRRELLRWILFLDTNQPFEWPRHPGGNPHHIAVKHVSLFGAKRRAQRFLKAGDYETWPFRSRADWKTALRHPKRFAGQSGNLKRMSK